MNTEDPHVVANEPSDHQMPVSIDETCCGKCPGATCYVDFLTGERS